MRVGEVDRDKDLLIKNVTHDDRLHEPGSKFRRRR